MNLRDFLVSECLFFVSNRILFWALRIFTHRSWASSDGSSGTNADSCIAWANLLKQSSRFVFWWRVSSDETTIPPDFVKYGNLDWATRALISSGSQLACCHCFGVYFIVALVFTLLTFWPPGPDDLLKIYSNSCRGTLAAVNRFKNSRSVFVIRQSTCSGIVFCYIVRILSRT